jgi:hypothetical protein
VRELGARSAARRRWAESYRSMKMSAARHHFRLSGNNA